jgi:cellulose synthase/poly-beta-1,6-N-acetylglucosamine synthase-like glycosyltransferase
VSLVIPAHNEEKVIAERIENAIGLDYPRDRLEIVVASDGSTDRTNDIVNGYIDEGVRLMTYPERRGKSATLNATVPRARGTIVVFTDANTSYKRDALRQLTRNFAQGDVGCVCGVLKLTNAPESLTSRGLGLYVAYETLLKALEARVGSLLFAYGAIYAIRKDLFTPVDPGMADDFAIPLSIALRGQKVVHEPRAVAFERSASEPSEEFARTVRMVTRDSVALFMFLGPALRQAPLIAWQLVSHKLLRWLIGLLQIGILLCSLLVLHSSFYRLIFASQLVFYLSALVGWALHARRCRAPLVSVPYFLCMLNAAALVGLARAAAGKRVPIWEKAQSSRYAP